MSRDTLTINLLGTTAFAGGHPRKQYRWLRKSHPDHRHAQPIGRGSSGASVPALVCDGTGAR